MSFRLIEYLHLLREHFAYFKISKFEKIVKFLLILV